MLIPLAVRFHQPQAPQLWTHAGWPKNEASFWLLASLKRLNQFVWFPLSKSKKSVKFGSLLTYFRQFCDLRVIKMWAIWVSLYFWAILCVLSTSFLSCQPYWVNVIVMFWHIRTPQKDLAYEICKGWNMCLWLKKANHLHNV